MFCELVKILIKFHNFLKKFFVKEILINIVFDNKDDDKISMEFFSEKNKFFNVSVIKYLFNEICFERDEINKF